MLGPVRSSASAACTVSLNLLGAISFFSGVNEYPVAGLILGIVVALAASRALVQQRCLLVGMQFTADSQDALVHIDDGFHHRQTDDVNVHK